MLNIISRKDRTVHVTYNNLFYIISKSRTRNDEVLIFKADKDGKITDWEEVGSSDTTEEAISNFKDALYPWKL